MVHAETKSEKENTLPPNLFPWNFGSRFLAFSTIFTIFYQNPLLCNWVRWFKITFSWWNERKEFKNSGKIAVWK